TNGTNAANVKSRAEQRAAAAEAKKRKRIIIGVVVALIAVSAIVVGVAFAMNGSHTYTEELVAIPECTAST
ncbi:serine/threonine protein kinase, partial [Bifidobacterium breve]|nr:serine/threonine protein kinase [Bifidobacterium breve]